jgi:hypothetical protein
MLTSAMFVLLSDRLHVPAPGTCYLRVLPKCIDIFRFRIKPDKYRYTIRYALLLHVSAYCGHNQVHTVFYIHRLFMSDIPPYTGQCLHIGSVLFGYIVFVCVYRSIDTTINFVR